MVEKMIVAVDVSAEEYMEKYAADFHEWVKGVVIKVSPVGFPHVQILHYLIMLFEAYFELNPIGRVASQPFVMEIEISDSRREPDLQIILNDNLKNLTLTKMVGAADICIEIVSPESVARDYGDKFVEYEKAGVREYWIIDPTRTSCRFHRLDNEVYQTYNPGAEGNYETPLLPRFKLHVPTLWQEELPKTGAVAESVKKAFEGKER
ncbi:MAG: Uma2 family endonuclease [Anaerolineae bacterium]|nr:Uma2 family endonuclease [Anaerolineae bacterium]